MYFGQVLRYYSREDVQQRMMETARGREVAGIFKTGSFSQRPGSLQYPADITSMVKNGALELHCSIERWSQPMALKADNYGQLRSGWDFVVDVDCEDFRHGRAAALVLCRALEEHGIRHYSVKFTGGTGFHIGVPWESMPGKVDFTSSVKLFPDLPRAMCAYLKDYCRDGLEKALLKLDSPEKLAEQANIKAGDLLTKDGINPFRLVELDHVLISPRHLFRMPYSLNMKSSLVSLPVTTSELGSFERRMAEPARVKAAIGFLDSGVSGEAGALVAEAADWQTKNRGALGGPVRKLELSYSRAVEPAFFPPCIKRILEGLQDGRKRSIFILANFLLSVGWKWEEIDRLLTEWNSRNIPPLPDNYIRYHIRRGSGMHARPAPPPGCKNEGWYDSIGVCVPDETCGGASRSVGNPARYPARRLGKLKEERGTAKGRVTAGKAGTGRWRERQGRGSVSVEYM